MHRFLSFFLGLKRGHWLGEVTFFGEPLVRTNASLLVGAVQLSRGENILSTLIADRGKFAAVRCEEGPPVLLVQHEGLRERS
eukprot:4396666-Amphidinium_carterae.2